MGKRSKKQYAGVAGTRRRAHKKQDFSMKGPRFILGWEKRERKKPSLQGEGRVCPEKKKNER